MAIENILSRIEADGQRLTIGLTKQLVAPGESVDVIVECAGRPVRWELEHVTLEIEVPYRSSDGYTKTTLQHSTLLEDTTIESELTEVHDYQMTIPRQMPRPVGGTDVLVSVEIATGTKTFVREQPLDVEVPAFQALFQAMIELGFTHREVEHVAVSSAPPFAQRLVFERVEDSAPTTLDQVTLYYQPTENGIRAFVRDEAGREPLVGFDPSRFDVTIGPETDTDAARETILSLLP